MRVTGGSAKGRRLKSPAAGVRPTSDLVREAIFDVLAAQGTYMTRVLDLYAGSGALGIEALSRGSERCDFVERSPANAKLIENNLDITQLREHGFVHRIAVARAAERLDGTYDLVLADPPYDDGAAPGALEHIAGSPLLSDDATLVWEHASREPPREQLGPLCLRWTRRYGGTQVSIYHREASAQGPRSEEREP